MRVVGAWRQFLVLRISAPLIMAGLMASSAFGQNYAGAAIYALTPPTGFTNGFLSGQPQAGQGGQIAGAGIVTLTGAQHAVLWPGPNAVADDLNPTALTGFSGSFIQATDGAQQVGEGSGTATGGNPQALLWSGSAASALDLNPTSLLGFTSSLAAGISATQQVGYGSGTATGGNNHALLWTGSAASAVDLNPTSLTGIGSSEAVGTDGSNQVGYGVVTATSANHAMLWSNTAASAVDLNPSFLGSGANSQADGVSGSQEVGYGFGSSTSDNYQALLWTGTAASAIDLNPSGVHSSIANGTNGSDQVGVGDNQAWLWSGSAASAVNLQTLLPAAGSWTNSTAYTIDNSGAIYGTADGTYNGVTGTFAVEWFPTVSWAAATSGNWSLPGQWSGNTLPSSGIGATFNTGSTTPYTVTLTGNASANSINVIGDKVTIQKAGFNLNVAGDLTINGTGGQTTILTLAGSGTDTFGALNIKGIAQLDITDNVVVINYGVGNASPVSTIAGYITTGNNGGTLSGVGIVSSKVASVNYAKGDPNLYAIGYADASDPDVAGDGFTPGTVIIEPALVGDANLDGKVNYTDFQLLSSNFNGANTSWDQADFNATGTTNFTDFQLLAANFNDSTSLDNAEFSSMNQFALKNGFRMTANADGDGFTLTAVPEPAALPLLAISVITLLRCRKKIARSA